MSALAWRASVGGRGREYAQFEHNGSGYMAYRTNDGPIDTLSKRARTNARGLHYVRLNLSGVAARAVLKAVQS